jgi:beta-glucuronidase
MFTSSRRRFDLTGAWRMMPDPYDVFERTAFWEKLDEKGRPTDHTPDAWPLIEVPSCWNAASPELHYYEGPAWYFKRFRFEKRARERYFLYFEAANYRTKAWINGVLLGEHEGGFTPFWFEVTEQLLPSNMLLVKVDSTRRADGVPTLVTDWFNFGGITRPVCVVAVPRNHIRNFKVSTRLAGDKTFVRFEVWTDGGRTSPVKVTIPEANFVDTIPQKKRNYYTAEFEIYPELWSPEKPRLYKVKLSHGKDSVSDAIGFREIRVESDAIVLNGRPIKLYGICLHEEADGKGRTLDRADVEQRLRWARELHCNFLRLAHYPHTEMMARAADRHGVLLWEEVPVYWQIAFTSKATLANAKQQLQRLVERDWNRAAVAFWSVGNETDMSYRGRNGFMGALADFAHKLDPTRLVTSACYLRSTQPGHVTLDDPLAAKLDVIGINEYFGWYVGAVEDFAGWRPARREAKPIIISETGAGAEAGHHGAKGTRWTEEFQAEFYRRQLALLAAMPQVKGIAPWLLMDFRSPLRTNRWQRGFNRKGVVSNSGKKKLAFRVLSGFYRDQRGVRHRAALGPYPKPQNPLPRRRSRGRRVGRTKERRLP